MCRPNSIIGHERLWLANIGSREAREALTIMPDPFRDEPQKTPESTPIARALKILQEGRLNEAEEIYASVLRAEPEHFDALHLLGALKHQKGESLEALRLVTAALETNPRSADAHSNHGLILAALKRDEEAIASFDRALAVNPGHLDALLPISIALSR